MPTSLSTTTTTTKRTQITSPSQTTSRKACLSIDLCLFGPRRECPSEVWEAILTTTSISSGVEEFKEKRRKSQTAACALDGIDDLHEKGRWNHSLVASSSSGNIGNNTNNASSLSKKHVISLQDLRRIASQGMTSHRPLAWRVLLGYLPRETAQWKDTLLQQRKLYRHLVSDLFVKPEHEGNELRGHVNTASGNRSQKQRQYMEGNLKQPDPSSRRQKSQQEIAQAKAAAAEISANILDDPPKSSLADPIPIQQANPTPPSANAETDGDQQDETPKTTTTTETTETAPKEQAPEASPNILLQKEGYAALVPARLREEWKKTGKDISALESMDGGSHSNMNYLLVQDHHSLEDESEASAAMDISDRSDSDAKWFQFFEHATLLDEIRKDVVRTHPDLFFFLEPYKNLGQRRYAALERILFVWAKLNKGVRYVQGMNEIVGTIYYVLANDENEEWACEAEADSYFLFNTLMMEMRDVFVPDLDEADTGIQGRISNMNSLLSLHDPEVRVHLVDIGIDPAFYAIRWLTTLLSREFSLPDTIRLWDSMFASTHKENFMRYVCVTMIVIIRDQLLKGDFSTCLRLLQSYPTTNIDSLLESSRALWIYESQVTLACHKGGISLHQALCTITPPPSIYMAYGLPGGVAKPDRLYNNNGGGMSRGGISSPNASAGSSPMSPTSSSSSVMSSLWGGARNYLSGLRGEVNRGRSNTR